MSIETNITSAIQHVKIFFFKFSFFRISEIANANSINLKKKSPLDIEREKLFAKIELNTQPHSMVRHRCCIHNAFQQDAQE